MLAQHRQSCIRACACDNDICNKCGYASSVSTPQCGLAGQSMMLRGSMPHFLLPSAEGPATRRAQSI
eukprot:3809270-Alexandrium_andersonii.AAC.1